MSATTKLNFENISVTLENSQFLFPTSPWLAKHLLLSVFRVFYKCFFHVFINGIKVYSFLHLSFFNLMPLRFLHVVVLFILPGCIFNCVDIPYFLFQTGSQGYPQVCYITEAGPELLVLLSLSPKLWNYKHMLSCPSLLPPDGHCGEWRLLFVLGYSEHRAGCYSYFPRKCEGLLLWVLGLDSTNF